MSVFDDDDDKEFVRNRSEALRRRVNNNIRPIGIDPQTWEQIRAKAHDVVYPFQPMCPTGYIYDESQAKCVPIKEQEEGSMYFHSRNDIPEHPVYTNMIFNGKKFKKEDVKSFSFTVDNNIDEHTGIARGQRKITFEVETKQGGKITGDIQTGDPTFKDDDMYKILGIPKDTKPKGYVEPYKRSLYEISNPNIKEPQFIEEATSIFLPNSPQHELSDSIKRAAWLGHTGTFHSNLFTGTVETKQQKPKENKLKSFNITVGKRDEDGDFDYNTITKTLSKDSPIMKIARVPKSKMPKKVKPKPISKRKQKEIEKENKYKQHPIEY